jgi:hypothetical protein
MQKRNLEQRCAIKFSVRLNETVTEPYEKLKRAYGDPALSRAQILGGIKHFRWP